jgi:hypothetical protein
MQLPRVKHEQGTNASGHKHIGLSPSTDWNDGRKTAESPTSILEVNARVVQSHGMADIPVPKIHSSIHPQWYLQGSVHVLLAVLSLRTWPFNSFQRSMPNNPFMFPGLVRSNPCAAGMLLQVAVKIYLVLTNGDDLAADRVGDTRFYLLCWILLWPLFGLTPALVKIGVGAPVRLNKHFLFHRTLLLYRTAISTTNYGTGFG